MENEVATGRTAETAGALRQSTLLQLLLEVKLLLFFLGAVQSSECWSPGAKLLPPGLAGEGDRLTFNTCGELVGREGRKGVGCN